MKNLTFGQNSWVKLCSLLFFLIFTLGTVTDVLGAAKTFTGPGNFGDASKWNGGTLPVAGDDLTINGTCAVDNNGTTNDVEYGTLLIGGATAGTVLSWAASGTNRLNVSNVSAKVNGSSLDMTDGGTLVIRGTWTSTKLSFTPGAGTIEIQSSMTMPAAYDIYNNLVINGSATTVSLGGGTTVNSNLTVTSGTLSVGAFNFTVTGTATVASTLTITSATGTKSFGNLIIDGTFNNTDANEPFTVNGDFQNNGVYNGGTARVTFTGAASNTISGSTGTTAFSGGITVDKGTSSDHVLDVQCVITLLSGGLTMTNGTFKLSSASTITPFTGNISGSPFLIPTTCGFWCNGGTISASANSWTVGGYLRVSAGTVNIGTAAHYLQPAGCTIIIDGGTLNVADRVSNIGVAWSFVMSSGTLTVPTGVSATDDRPPFLLDLATDNFSMSGGTIVIRRKGGTAGQNLGYHNVAAGGTGFTGGTLQIGDSSTPAAQTIKITTNIPIHNLTVNSANVTAEFATYAPTINGDITLTAGTLDMGGFNMAVQGDWMVESGFTFTPGASTVTLNGSAATQTIGGTAVTGFYNLVMNNSYATGPQFALGNNVTIQNTLTMTLGQTDLAGYTLTLGTAAATPGTLTYTAGWMYGGNVRRYVNTPIIAIGNAAGHFPIGTSLDYRPFWVGNTGALTTGGTITVGHTGTYPASSYDVNLVDASWGSTVIYISEASWNVSTSDITVGASPFSVRMEGTGLGTVAAVSDLSLTLAASVGGTHAASAGTVTNPQVNRTGLTLAQLNNGGTQAFRMGSRIGTSPLPIKLLKFEAAVNAMQKVDLTWATASESNNNFFTIERTADGINFEKVINVKGAGNSNVNRNYSAVDTYPMKGKSYYRLKQTDFDGRFTYSGLVAIDMNSTKNPFSVFPNPSSDGNIFFRMNAFSRQSTVVINSMTGAQVYSKIISPKNGPGPVAIATGNKLSPGIYNVTLSSEGKIFQQKLIVK